MRHLRIVYCVLLALMCQIALMADNYVIFNQIMYDSPLNEQVTEPPYSNGEFMELYNGSDNVVSLQGWYITGESPTEHFDFPDMSIASKGFLTIAFRHEDSPSFVLGSVFDLPTDNPDFHLIYQHNVILANHGETIALYNANDEIVDQIYYDGTSHKTKPDRFSADNEDGTPGNQCVSLHRTWVEFDENGLAVPGTAQFKTDLVTFNSCRLAEATFGEHSLTGTQPLPSGENYILSVAPLDPTTRVSISNNGVSVSNGVRTQTSIMYYDGLGRTDESILLGVTPDKNDIVVVTDYYDKRQIARQWLPVPMQTEGQRINIADIKAQAQIDYDDERPFSELLYENTSRKRQIAQTLPGETYQNYKATQTYRLNGENDNVRVYTVNTDCSLHTDGTYYGAGTLYKKTIADEDGKSVTTYMDKLGRKLMEERNSCRTYYVYDDLGYLRFVLPNLPLSKLSSGDYSLNNTTLKSTAYCYKYDDRGNIIYKRLPGCDPQYMVYDQAGHLILSQDGDQRLSHKWTLFTYDSIGRNLYTAELLSIASHEYHMSFFADRWYVEHYGNNPSNTSLPGTGYASSIFPKSNLRLLTVNYYDDYDYLSRLSTPLRQAVRFVQESGYSTQHNNATGMLTGTRVYNLSEDNTYTATAYYYDTKGRIVQNRSVRTLDGYKTAISTEYLFNGSVAQRLTVQGTDSCYVREHYRYTYDHAGRAKQVYYQLNNDEEILLSAFSYDSIGRLVQNLLYNNTDTVAYSYDIRNMLTETHNKHFSERFYYADSVSNVISATPCYNGNIALACINHNDTAYMFAYNYDSSNRLTITNQLTNYGTSYKEQFTYDDFGNILTLKRFKENRQIDDLKYTYTNEGNQLLSIIDNGQDANLTNSIEYHNGDVTTDTTMHYDANGNLIYDLDRGISAIRYNILNLPDTIQFINGNQIVNLYDAVGRKYKSVIYYNIATVITPHYEIAPYTFETDSVVYSITEYTGNIETIFTKTDTIARRIHNAIGYYADSTYYHYIKDHLGNICAVVNSAADTLVQSTIYYPSGVPMAQSFGREKQPYLYNGKEFIEVHGLNTFDYGFRNYYASIGRFTSLDPLAEKTPWQSPYSYAGNNFTNAIDWMGLGRITFSNHSSYGWLAVNSDGIVLEWGDDENDYHVYEVDATWDHTYKGLEGHSEQIGWEIFDNYGNRSRYIKGEKAYYLKSMTRVIYLDRTWNIIGYTALAYGNQIVNTNNTINNNLEAIWHYYFGNGRPIQNGAHATNAFKQTSKYKSILTDIAKGGTHGAGAVNMEFGMFHIGRTVYSYHINGKMLIIGFALYDGFWDPNYPLERLGNILGLDWSDGEGPGLELGGIPYSYIPSVIILNLEGN